MAREGKGRGVNVDWTCPECKRTVTLEKEKTHGVRIRCACGYEGLNPFLPPLRGRPTKFPRRR